MSKSFTPLSNENLRSLLSALRRNAEGAAALKMGRDTSFADEHDDIDELDDFADVQVIDAVKSMPCHYGD
jgi:hypothetical protein